MKVRDFRELGLIFDTVALRVKDGMKTTAKDIGEGIERRARSKLGEYQPGWPGLAESTIADRTKHGYPADEPLLREGNLRASIHNTLRERSRHIDVFVGSNSPYARRQEMGFASSSSSTPPRPYLAPAAVEATDDIQKKVAILLEFIWKGAY